MTESTTTQVGLVELRVHGVGGTSPETLLGVPFVELVGGDRTAGFFRPPTWIPVDDPPRALEGYSWGGLTSRARARALWLLLLPFALVNLAGWMFRTHGTADQLGIRSRTRVESGALGLIRLYGLIITVSAWTYLSVIVVDVVAYQCGIQPGCSNGRWFMWPWERAWVMAEPARGIGVAVGLLALVTLAIAQLVRRSQEAVHPGESFGSTDDPAWKISLRNPELWRSPQNAHRLGLTHTAAALATIGLAAARVVELASTGGTSQWFSLGFLALLVIAGLFTLRLEGVSQRFHVGLLAVTSAWMTTFEVWVFRQASIRPDLGQAPGARVLTQWSYLVGGLVVVLLAVFHLKTWLGETAGRNRDWPLLFVPLGILVAAPGPINAVGSGMLIRIADLLGDAVPASTWQDAGAIVRDHPIVYSDTVGGTAVFTVLTMVVFTGMSLVGWAKTRKKAPTFDELQRRYEKVARLDSNDPAHKRWAAKVGKAEALAAMTDQAGFILGATAVVVGGLAAVATLMGGFNLSRAGQVTLPALQQPASYLLGLLPILALWLLDRVYRSPGLRRGVGSIWDVATFWPRWFHPWAPPSYGERAVPQLQSRIQYLSIDNQIILSGHSQGTAIGIATFASLLDDAAARSTFERTVILTHGSPIARLYSRYFPEYFDQSLFRAIHERLGRTDQTTWFNLRRRTDYIGGAVFHPEPSGVEDLLVLDPETPLPPAPGEPAPAVRGHSDYYQQSEYQAIIHRIAKI